MFILGFAATSASPKPEPAKDDEERSERPEAPVEEEPIVAETEVPEDDQAPEELVAAAIEDEDDGSYVAEEVNQALMTVLPWGISVVFHAAIVLLAVFVAYTAVVQVPEEEIVIPVVKLSATPGAPLQVKEPDSVKQSSQNRNTQRRVVQRQTAPQQTTNALTGKVETSTAIIGSSGGLGSGKASPFSSGLDGAAGAGFKASFFGSGGNARRIVFIVDATGSLIDTLPFVIQELKKTVQQLSERQQFAVIFFRGDGVVEVPPRGLKVADARNKQAVIEWIDLKNHNIEPGGKANPVKALQAALAYKPELLFLLSDNITGEGQYEIDQKNLLDEIKRANTSGTKINTIQFVSADPLERMGLKGTMQLIAEQTGGIYRFVDEKELNLK